MSVYLLLVVGAPVGQGADNLLHTDECVFVTRRLVLLVGQTVDNLLHTDECVFVTWWLVLL